MNEPPSQPPGSERANPLPKTYSTPRRFGIGTMLALVTACGILVWLLQLLNTPPAVVGFISVLLATVTVMQAVFHDDPRLGSEAAGVICCLGWFVYYLFVHEIFGCEMVCVAPLIIGLGAIIGYGGGVVVGGFFMVMENVTRKPVRDMGEVDRDMDGAEPPVERESDEVGAEK